MGHSFPCHANRLCDTFMHQNFLFNFINRYLHFLLLFILIYIIKYTTPQNAKALAWTSIMEAISSVLGVMIVTILAQYWHLLGKFTQFSYCCTEFYIVDFLQLSRRKKIITHHFDAKTKQLQKNDLVPSRGAVINEQKVN